MLVAVLALVVLNVGVSANDDPDPSAPTTLIVTKDLLMNEGTTLPPGIGFDFELQYIDSYPVLSQTITGFPAGVWVSGGSVPSLGAPVPHPTIPGAIVSTGTSADLLANIVWPGPGQFDFLLREVDGTTTLVNADGVRETMTYDDTVFGVRVWVHSGPDGLFVAGVHVFDEGFEQKEDPIFTNTFIREVNGEEDDLGLKVSKTVAGEMADETRDFTFTATLTSAAFSTSEGTYTATIVGAGPNEGDIITFTPPAPTTFTLRHGQTLVFSYLPVGTGFQVVESNYAPYTPTIDLTVNGTLSAITGSDTNAHNVGEALNYAAFTNTLTSTPITGLIMNSLPFVLVGVAAVGFFAMTVANKKRRAHE